MVLRKTLENETVEELRYRASKMNVEGRSSMNREELIDAMASDSKAASDVDTTDDRPREAQQNTNPDGSRKPTANELKSAAAAFKAEMLRDGASEEDVNKALSEAEAYTPPAVFEVAVGNHGHATPYTTPSSFALAGVPKGTDVDAEGELPGGTSKDAV